MSSLAFLLHPQHDISQDYDPEWFGRCTAWISGTWSAWMEFRRNLADERRPAGDWFDSPNLTSNAANYMAYNRAEHKPAFREYVEARHREWEANGRPDIQETNSAADFARVSGLESRICLGNLAGYRGLSQIPRSKLKHGGVHGLLKNEANPDAFDLTLDDVEPAALAEIVRTYGGLGLMLWTYGHTLHMLLCHGGGNWQISLRLSKPDDGERSVDWLAELRGLLADSDLKPDWEEISGQLCAREIEISRWFEAFGLAGAYDLIPKQGSALWAQLENVAGALLQGKAPDPSEGKSLSAELKKLKDQQALPARPGQGMVRKIFGVAITLRNSLGLKGDCGSWPTRFAAASRYWDIVDGPALDHLTVGVDRKGQGCSASLGRLLAYYPREIRRDGLFWSLATAEAESANGHAFVQSMEALAENACSAGFTVVILPVAQLPAFRKAFGIDGGQAVQERGWSAEAFVDLPGVLKVSIAEAASAWFGKSKAAGLVMRVESQGTSHLEAFEKGISGADPLALLGHPLPTQQDVSRAAAQLAPEALLESFGLASLLAPILGDAPAQQAPQRSRQETVSACAEVPVSEVPLEELGRRLPPLSKGASAQLHLCISPATRDSDYVQSLASDLSECLRLRTWVDQGRIYAQGSANVSKRLFLRLLGDLPRGSCLVVVHGGGSTGLRLQ